MWGPNFDWVPDQDHGNNILTTLHCMLLQAVGDKLYRVSRLAQVVERLIQVARAPEHGGRRYMA